MSGVRYSDIRNGKDSASDVGLHDEMSDIYKWFGITLLFAGGAAFAITNMDTMNFLTHPIFTVISFASVMITGYFGYRIILDSHVIFGKIFLIFHALSWGILVSPVTYLHPSLDTAIALISCGIVFTCMSFLGQIEEYVVVGNVSLVILVTLGCITSFLMSILVLNAGAISFVFSFCIVVGISFMVWREGKALKVILTDVTHQKYINEKSGILGAMHLIGSASSTLICLSKLAKR